MGKDKLLVIGPRRPITGSAGGVVVSFELFLAELDRQHVAYEVIDLDKRNYSNIVVGGATAIFRFIRLLPRSKHISLHLKNNDFIFLAPIVVAIARMFRKPVSLRKFAGNFDEIFDRLDWFRRRLVTFSLKQTDYCFFETHYLVDKFRTFNSATYWFPNPRVVPSIGRPKDRVYLKRLIFVGHVRQEKGMDELLSASQEIGPDYSFHIYGATVDPKYEGMDWSQYPNISYYGQIPASDIPTALAENDVLVLPSYREGYPGAIIEALQVGLPVIASRLQGIEEIITDGVEGRLIEPRDSRALVDAIHDFDEDNYKSMSEMARERGRSFDSAVVTTEFLHKIGFHS